jgi:hypothetical protein
VPIIVARDEYGHEYHVKVSRADDHLRSYSWHISRRGYAYRKTSIRRPGRKNPTGASVYMHREICDLQIGDPRVPDHKNRDKLDNRRSNLEVLSCNAENVRRANQQDGSTVVAWEEPQVQGARLIPTP